MADEGLEKTRLYRTSSKRLSTPLIITVVLLLAVLLGGAYVFFQAQKSTKNVESPLPTGTVTVPTEVPTPTTDVTPTDEVTTTPAKATPTTKPTVPAGSFDRSDFSIAILNGSGTPGAASKIGDSLEELGYTIASTGNAETFDYEDINIFVKKGNTALLNQLKKDVATLGTVGSASATFTGSGDAQIIVGK